MCRYPDTVPVRAADLRHSQGKPDNRNNVRRRLLVKAIERANEQLADLGIDPIGDVSPHGLRRTYATLRCVAGDDVVYVANQLGHVSPASTLSVYAQATKHRDRLVGAERIEYSKALEWARMGTTDALDGAPAVPVDTLVEATESAYPSRA